MLGNNKLAGYFNLENFRLKNRYNIIYNNKMNFYIKAHNGWLLNKKATRQLLIQNMHMFLKEFSLKANSMVGDIMFHSYKIKNNNKKINSEYLNFLEFIILILKNFNPELFRKLEERNYLNKLKSEIRYIYSRIQEKKYYTAIAYGALKEDYNLIKDHFYLNFLMNEMDGDLFFELLNKYNDMYLSNITDGLEYLFGLTSSKELNNLQFLYNFFSEDINYLENNSEVIKLLDELSENNELIVEFNNYLQQYERFSSNSKLKYKNKVLYQLYLLYEKTKERYLKNFSKYETLVPIKIKEGDIYKINEYFYKTLYIVPIKKSTSSNILELNIQQIEEILDSIDSNFGYILNLSIKPYSEIDYEILFDENNINDMEARKSMIDAGLFHTNCTITLKTTNYNLFSSIEEKIKQLEITYDLKVVENKDISNLFPFYRNRKLSFTTSSLDLFPPEFIENPMEDVFTNFFPKNINYEKGAIFGYNKETLKPVFFNAGDTSICMNKHMIVLGKSGSGKTYGTKILVKNALMFNKFIIIDHMQNYNNPEDNFIEKHGGKIISFSSDTLVNPLIFNRAIGLELETHLEYLLSIFSGEKGEALSKEERRLLLLVLSSLYKQPYRPVKNDIIKINLDEIIKRTQEFAEGYTKAGEAENSIIGKSLVQYLKSLKTSKLGKYLMSDEQLDIIETLKKENLVLFDFFEIRESNLVMTIFGFLVIQSIYKYIKDSYNERVKIIKELHKKGVISEKWYAKNIDGHMAIPVYLVIDEIHEYLGNSVMGEKLQKFVKEARNKSAGLIAITQQISDFLNNKFGESIFTQSTSYLIFNKDLPVKDAEIIHKNLLSKDDPLGLDDSDISYLFNSTGQPVGSALFLHGALPSQKIRTLTDPDFIK